MAKHKQAVRKQKDSAFLTACCRIWRQSAYCGTAAPQKRLKAGAVG
ncbi:hypothetical protein KNP414_06191 [Paenibacillus mucilaginosus KNP414]|uniref:Uncharacterized protein n=1 Tax=Paenibacillus mucilaginosus (strain KNP414) TaxID=1036673 RepID=F8FIH1_PAEMK|nr:hypothetical protein KNP414_06191 [Paenibacillus mucilaginosus KNP414]